MQPVVASCVSGVSSCSDTTDDSGVLLGSLAVLIAVLVAVIVVRLRRSRSAPRVAAEPEQAASGMSTSSPIARAPATDLDRAGRSDLHYAALEDRLDDLRRLVEAGADVNLADRNGYTPLHFAAQEHALAALHYLISAGADLELEDSYGNTPLWRATMSSRGRGEAITALRSAGADPWHINKTGASPVTIARRVSNFDIRQWYADLGDARPAP